MKIKKISLVALGLCSVLAVAGCKKDPTTSNPAASSGNSPAASSTGTEQTSTSTSLDGGNGVVGEKAANLDVLINYYSSSKSFGVTYQGDDTYTNKFDGLNYAKGALLPTWKAFGQKLNMTIRDAADYSKTSNNDQHKAIYTSPASQTKFKTDAGEMVDLYMNSQENMTAAGTAGDLVNLMDYLHAMPNFKKFLEANPSVLSQLKNDRGELFIAPYFDGKDTIEKMFLMDTAMVKKLLDTDNAAYDTADTIAETAYTPFIGTYNNTKIPVVGLNGKADEITVSNTKDVITLQNELTTKNGQTLTTTLKDYLKATYGSYVGAGKLYANYSDIFVSANACYNVDELVALMRCVKTNTQFLTGQNEVKVQVLFPREMNSKADRTDSIIQFAQAWGVQGLTAEKDYLYYDKDGNLHDARTTLETYTNGLDNLAKLYSEGLIRENYYDGSTTVKCAATYIKGGYGFMEYDYNATSAVYNRVDDNGIGEKDGKTNGFMPVLAPVTKWANDDHTKYEYTRHSDDGRALKTGGWVIPKNTDNLAGALEMIDYIFSKEGADLQDFGPDEYRDGTMTLSDGTECVKIKPAVLKEISTESLKLGWNNWYRRYVGSTEGIGHVRNNGLDYQVTNAAGQTGLSNVTQAIGAGVMSVTLTYGADGFNKCVPTTWNIPADTLKSIDADANQKGLNAFWKVKQSGNAGRHGWVTNSGAGMKSANFTTLQGYFKGCDTAYLAIYQMYND